MIGEYYLTEDDSVGWDTAERTCFDPDFKRGKLKFSSIYMSNGVRYPITISETLSKKS